MKIYSGQVPVIAAEIVDALISNEDIDVLSSDKSEVEEDIASVLREYIRRDHELSDRARDTIERRKLDSTSFGRMRRQLAKQAGFGIGEDAFDYILEQTVEMLMQSRFVEEVYADDQTLRLRIVPVLRRHGAIDESLDREVRRRIRNLNEGDLLWDVEYQKVMGDMRKRKNL